MSLRSISSRPIMSLVVSALVLLITLEFLFDFEVSIFPDIHELSMLPSRQWHQIVDWYANYMNSKNPALETNVLGCGAQFAGADLMHDIMTCTRLKHKKFPTDRTANLGVINVHDLNKYEKVFHLTFSTKHYGDFLAFAPVMTNLRAVIVIRHPLDRILEATDHYKTSYDPWLLDKAIYEGHRKTSFQTYINSLDKSTALLYGIYIASLYYSSEINELHRIRELLPENSGFIKFETFYHKTDEALKDFSRILNIDEDIVKSCTPTSLRPWGFSNSGSYSYKKDFDCVHYVYYEKLIGVDSLTAFGYDDRINEYNISKHRSCKGVNMNDFETKKWPRWPTFDSMLFNSSFTSYEFLYNKIMRLSRAQRKNHSTAKMLQIDEIKKTNHKIALSVDAKPNSLGQTNSVINPIELNQILETISSRRNKVCSNESNYHSYDQSLTTRYLRYIKGTKENEKIKNSKILASDSNFPALEESSWISQFCPEVVTYFKEYGTKYFDYYPADQIDPLVTTEAALALVCLLKAVEVAANTANAKWALFAGTQLGAILHGGPIPWDDDIDLIVDGKKANAFMNALDGMQVGNRKVKCTANSPSIKCRQCFIDDGVYPVTRPDIVTRWPYVEIFFYYIGDEITLEFNKVWDKDPVIDSRKLVSKVWRNDDFLPFRQALYGGLLLPTLRLNTAILNYDIDNCFSKNFNHRIEVAMPKRPAGYQLNCCELSKHLPFVWRVNSRYEIGVSLEIAMIGDKPTYLSRVNLDTGLLLGSYFLTLHSSKSGNNNSSLRKNSNEVKDYITYKPHKKDLKAT